MFISATDGHGVSIHASIDASERRRGAGRGRSSGRASVFSRRRHLASTRGTAVGEGRELAVAGMGDGQADPGSVAVGRAGCGCAGGTSGAGTGSRRAARRRRPPPPGRSSPARAGRWAASGRPAGCSTSLHRRPNRSIEKYDFHQDEQQRGGPARGAVGRRLRQRVRRSQPLGLRPPGRVLAAAARRAAAHERARGRLQRRRQPAVDHAAGRSDPRDRGRRERQGTASARPARPGCARR